MHLFDMNPGAGTGVCLFAGPGYYNLIKIRVADTGLPNCHECSRLGNRALGVEEKKGRKPASRCCDLHLIGRN